MNPSLIQFIGAVLFGIAILHTFSTQFFEQLAHKYPQHAGLWHLLSEIEVVFGFWAFVLVLFMFALEGRTPATQYLESRNFTEPMFVFAIMVIAGTRPILESARWFVQVIARYIPISPAVAFYGVLLSVVPLLGSLITEPAAMTLAALILSRYFFNQTVSNTLRYGTLGVLFVNISIGGTLTPFAAPPVLMVAGQWNWDIIFMLSHFGWKAAIAVLVNALGVTLLLRHELKSIPIAVKPNRPEVPTALVLTHLIFLFGIVLFAHHPAIFMGLFLFFLGIAQAYQHHQDRLILREGLLVAFFLAGLVVLGGQQQWWLSPLLMSMSSDQVFVGATLLTAVTDNAALTYLGSLVPGLSPEFQYALVAGAVAGGGLTVIANAPNPAGIAILRKHFQEEVVHPGGLVLAAFAPTLIAALAFRFL
jgi:hypothetical protein